MLPGARLSVGVSAASPWGEFSEPRPSPDMTISHVTSVTKGRLGARSRSFGWLRHKIGIAMWQEGRCPSSNRVAPCRHGGKVHHIFSTWIYSQQDANPDIRRNHGRPAFGKKAADAPATHGRTHTHHAHHSARAPRPMRRCPIIRHAATVHSVRSPPLMFPRVYRSGNLRQLCQRKVVCMYGGL